MPDTQPSLLIVEDDADVADQLRWALVDDYDVSVAGSRDEALGCLRQKLPDVILLDLCLPPENTPEVGFELLTEANAAGAVVVVMSALGERAAAVRAIREGAYDFFDKPVDLNALRVVVGRALERQALERENRALRQQLQRRYHLNGIVGTSAAMLDVFDAVRRVADTPLTVIIQGESGTGKGLFARAIHYNSSRKDGPFLAVNCSAFPETLLEAELFGHEKGAFTGASHDRVGRFEAANGGTLFLDEIACISPAIQIKLLGVLEERTIERLGSNRTRRVDIRLVVASNEDLERKVREGSFREDFYFRVRGFPIVLPALRERVEDIPLLATQFLKRTCDERRVPLKNLDSRARAMLMTRPWPGNVRELRSVIETLVLMVDDATIVADDVSRMFPSPNEVEDATQAARQGFKQAVESYERRLLLDAIHQEGGVKARAARRLGLDPGQMKYLSRKYDL